MKKQTLRDFAPPWVELKKEVQSYLVYGILLIVLASFGVFLISYASARAALYYYPLGVRTLREGTVIRTLPKLLDRTFLPACGYGLLCFISMIYNYAGFFRESKSIYLMRRIPDRFELARRCVTIPLLAMLAGMALCAGLICLCNLIYFRCTPEAAIPPGSQFTFWRAF